ncbi:MAG: T9SS type A sorting domain-containing protein [Bacteroidota bacterium]|nr:T9SS type A sorting domain-containing protein [Bacteroidota bacterium]
MKKLYIIIALLLPVLSAWAQPCTPDPTLTTPGIKPSKIPNGVLGISYSQVISLMVPLDTTVVWNSTAVNIKVDSATVIYLSDFPYGFTYECDKISRTWNGGQKGCARLFGMPDTNNLGDYKIWVKTRTYFKIVGITGNFDQIDSSAIDFTIQQWPLGLRESLKFQQLKMSPNPVINVISVEMDQYNSKAHFIISNILGQQFTIVPVFEPNTSEIKFDVSALPSGVYIIKSEIGNQIAQSRFVKE